MTDCDCEEIICTSSNKISRLENQESRGVSLFEEYHSTMESGEPQPKRQYLAKADTFLKLKDDHLKEDFIKTFRNNFLSCAKFPCRSLKFNMANAATKCSYSFVEACCDVAVNSDCEYAFGSFFEDGVVLLHKYVNDPRKVQATKQEELLLEKLLNFINDKVNIGRIHDALQENWLSEARVASTIAHHILSKLSMTPTFTIDHTYGIPVPPKDGEITCLCGCGEEIKGWYEDTTFGNTQVWHGRADILANDKSVAVGGISFAVDSQGRSMVEVKTEFKEVRRVDDQIISQCICFSFLQGKRHPEYTNTLIPSIGISCSDVMIFFYDSKHDKLLQCATFSLFERNKSTLKISSIIGLWLALNYKVFSSSSPSISAFVETLPSADFFVVAKEKLNIYRSNLQFGKCSGHEARAEQYRIDGEVNEEELKSSEKLKSLGITKQ